MASTRTQVYLTVAQRKRLDAIARTEDRSLAELIREAVDAYLTGAPPEPKVALDATFGIAPDFQVPSRDEWDRDG
ncbi:MAG: ribbon-helix-helix domain-containing protein [Actinomycetota bacterium]